MEGLEIQNFEPSRSALLWVLYPSLTPFILRVMAHPRVIAWQGAWTKDELQDVEMDCDEIDEAIANYHDL